MKKIVLVLEVWIPLSIIITAFCGLVYVTVQQNIRLSANDPQIQMSEDAAANLVVGLPIQAIVPEVKVNIANSLSPYTIIFDDIGRPIASSAELDGKTPTPPQGVFDFARLHGSNRFTWEPKPMVRSAVVITSHDKGFVLVGRSLREVEHRESQLMIQVAFVWAVSLIVLFVVSFLQKHINNN